MRVQIETETANWVNLHRLAAYHGRSGAGFRYRGRFQVRIWQVHAAVKTERTQLKRHFAPGPEG
jgi:hypothetical protein